MAAARTNVDVSSFPQSFLNKAAHVFLRPSPQYSWDDIVPHAVAQNTFRGFHRIDTTRSGAKDAFVGYFKERRKRLIESLLKVRTRDELYEISNNACDDVRARLTNCKQVQLRPYNKIRKPVDLYFEHLIAMAIELDEARAQLVPLLSLPLDCQILASSAIFTDHELRRYGLSRRSTYKDVTTAQTYAALQELLAQKATAISEIRGSPFHVIYFDLIWNDRYRKEGGNLFETNP